MTFKTSERTAYLAMCAVCTHPPMQMNNKTLGLTEPKFTKVLPDVEQLSSMLSQQSALWSVHRCRMTRATFKKKVTSAKHKTGPANKII